MPNKLKFGVIGVGNMGTTHARHLFEKKIEGAYLCALCDIDKKVRERLKSTFSDVPVYDSHEEMLIKADIDAVIIATPHYFHPLIARDCFLADKHVLTEKPIGVLQTEIERMIKSAKQSGKVFGIMFNQRTNELFKRAKKLVENGEIGVKKRLVWQTTNWYRTQSYYESSPWRASWRGEGGGVLMNQAPHQLDLLQWIFGMPDSVYANISIAKYHNIEVEDDAELLFGYSDGSSAVFVTSTGESPGTNRLEISGDKGKMVLEDGKLKLWKLREREREFCFSKQEGFYDAPYDYEEFTSSEDVNGHIAVLQNFCNHILYGEELIANGFDGVFQSQLTASAYLSHFIGKRVPIPCDSLKIDKLLLKKAKKSPERKNVKKIDEDCSQRWKVRW